MVVYRCALGHPSVHSLSQDCPHIVLLVASQLHHRILKLNMIVEYNIS